jgi:phosphonate transport system permease protein
MWRALGVLGFLAVTYWAGSDRWGIGFLPGEVLANLTRGAGILAEFFPPNWGFLPQTVEPFIETMEMAVIASVVGCGVALPLSFIASRVTSPNLPAFFIDKGILNVIRALPDLLYALVFVTALSVGPLPGILALVLFNVGVTAKLLSETVDGVDTGPLEAARATGAGRLQSVVSSVLPQVMPHYVAYSLYVFELNVRASTVIGLVGAGGIGQTLIVELKFFSYANVTVIMLEIFLIVFLIELVSIALRRRLV